MKKIEAIIKPFKLDEVKEALQEDGHSGPVRDRGQRVSAARRATPNCIAAQNTSSTFLPESEN